MFLCWPYEPNFEEDKRQNDIISKCEKGNNGIRIRTLKSGDKRLFQIDTAWNTTYMFEEPPKRPKCFMFWLLLKTYNSPADKKRTIPASLTDSKLKLPAITSFEINKLDYHYYHQKVDKALTNSNDGTKILLNLNEVYVSGEDQNKFGKPLVSAKFKVHPGGACCKLNVTLTSPALSKCYFAWAEVPDTTKACVPRLRPPRLDITTGFTEKAVEADMDASQKNEYQKEFGPFLNTDGDSQIRDWILAEIKDHFNAVFDIPTKKKEIEDDYDVPSTDEHLLENVITELKKNGNLKLENILFSKDIPCDPVFDAHRGGMTQLRQLVYVCYGLETKLNVVDVFTNNPEYLKDIESLESKNGYPSADDDKDC